MVIYEVNLKINSSIYTAYCAWLKPHIAEILQIPEFIDCKVFAHETPDPAYKELVLHYTVQSLDALEKYFSTQAPAMRQQALSKFGDTFSATRRVLQECALLSPLRGPSGHHI